jgi:hypothetical protein
VTTVAPPLLRAALGRIIGHYPSAVLSGIVPDQQHLDDGGYHVSIDDLRRYGNAGDYSNTRPLDKAPPVTAAGRRYAAAGDISLGRTDMIKLHGHVRRAWLGRSTDTRAKYINAINCWDGSGDPVRYNFARGTAERASKDHTWHTHEDQPRAYIDDTRDRPAAERAARALVSVMTGQSHDAWQRQEKLGPYAPSTNPPAKPSTPTDREDDDMIVTTVPLPAVWAFDDTGKPLYDAAFPATIDLPLPPAGHKDHRWGKDFKLYLSLGWSGLDVPGRVQVQIHDGKKWHTSVVDLAKPGGARKGITVPVPAAQSAYNISAGRMRPKITAGADVPAPTGSITLLAEMLRN